MRLQKYAPLIESSLRRDTLRPVASSLCNRCRRYASSKAYPEKVAVLGGGISGLASAYYVSKEFPQSKITVHEANRSDEGNGSGAGWIRSERRDVPGGEVLFEHGPRTLRPGKGAEITAQLIQDLNLTDNVIFTKKNSPGASNRYIFYPDRLVLLPSPGMGVDFWLFANMWSAGLLAGLPRALLEPVRPGRPDTLRDESIGSFIERRCDRRLADNLASAFYHGIYAGDIWQLSARTLLSQGWQLEGLAGSMYRGAESLQVPSTRWTTLYHPYDFTMFKNIFDEVELDRTFFSHINSCAMFSFKNGVSELILALQNHLQKNKQVDLKFGSSVKDTRLAENQQQIEVDTGSLKEKYDLVINATNGVGITPYVTVMTVNLHFQNPNLISHKGFGYLIPQSVPFAQNPERALGVIFDSDAITGQDTAKGTKLTVMLGGHYWDGWDHYPTTEEGYSLAMSLLRRHLHIKEDPTQFTVNLNKRCIPQYTVGYEDRLKDFACSVRDKYKGKVRYVGTEVGGGVGVNDCIRSAWAMARDLRGVGWKENGTGMERALDDRPWIPAPSFFGTVRLKN